MNPEMAAVGGAGGYGQLTIVGIVVKGKVNRIIYWVWEGESGKHVGLC